MDLEEGEKTCFIYARTSSDKNDDKVSCDLQIAQCTRYAESQNIKVVGVFRDDDRHGWTYWLEGFAEKVDDQVVIHALMRTAKKRRCRSGLGDLLSRISEVDILLSNDPSRLMRVKLNSSLAQNLFNKINASQIKLYFADRGFFDHNNAQANSIFMFEQGMRQASKEEELKRARQTLRNNRVSNRKYRSCKCLGIKDHIDSSRVKLVKKELATVYLIYDLFWNENLNRNQIVKHLLENNIPTAKGGSWGWCTVNSVLSNPNYIGKVWKYSKFDEEELSQKNELIDSSIFLSVKKYLNEKFNFTDDLYFKVQKKLNLQSVDRSSQRTHVNPLSKKVVCMGCGSFMQVNHYKREEKLTLNEQEKSFVESNKGLFKDIEQGSQAIGSLYGCRSTKYTAKKRTRGCDGATISLTETTHKIPSSGLFKLLKNLFLVKVFEDYENSLKSSSVTEQLSRLELEKSACVEKVDKIVEAISINEKSSILYERLQLKASKLEKEIKKVDEKINLLVVQTGSINLTLGDFLEYCKDENKFLRVIDEVLDVIKVSEHCISVKFINGQEFTINRFQHQNSWYLPSVKFKFDNLDSEDCLFSGEYLALYDIETLLENEALINEYPNLPVGSLKLTVYLSYPQGWDIINGRCISPFGEKYTKKTTSSKFVFESKHIKIISLFEDDHLVSFRGKKYNIYQFAKEFKIPLKTVQWRLKKGWTLQKIIETPIRSLGHRRLSEKEVEEIKDLCKKRSMLINDIAKKYGVCRDTISRIKNKHAHKE